MAIISLNWIVYQNNHGFCKYPGAYLNMALLSAQVQNYEGAIFQMKRYLMLVPEAEDSRSAQDKIYEWEAIIGK